MVDGLAWRPSYVRHRLFRHALYYAALRHGDAGEKLLEGEMGGR